ncbi:MAG: hypothetical protein ACR2QH_00160, partial [Geminicoccaceae bacterium]
MVEYIRSGIFRPDLARLAYRTDAIARPFINGLGSGALVLAFAGGTLGGELVKQEVPAAPKTEKQASIQLAALDERPFSSATYTPVPTKVHHQLGGKQERVVFNFDTPVQSGMHLDNDQLVVWFDHLGRFDPKQLRADKDGRLRHIEAVGGETTRWVILHLAPDSRSWSDIEQDGRRLIISLGPKRNSAGPNQDGVPAADVTPLAAKLSALHSNGWKPRRRTALKREPVAGQQDAKIVDGGSNQVTVAKPPAALTAQIQQAAPKIDGVVPKKAPIAPAATKTSPRPSPRQAPAPGQFEVDEQALDRALERTLTREGAVLLPFGTVEIEPGIRYVRQEFDAPTLINLFGFPAFG